MLSFPWHIIGKYFWKIRFILRYLELQNDHGGNCGLWIMKINKLIGVNLNLFSKFKILTGICYGEHKNTKYFLPLFFIFSAFL